MDRLWRYKANQKILGRHPWADKISVFVLHLTGGLIIL
jgi:hypothetical protein